MVKLRQRETMKRIKYAIILFYAALFAGLAFYDEKAAPELAREMARTQPETIEPGNAWIVFLGFAAPEGVSPYTYGAEKLQKLKKAIATGKSHREVMDSSLDVSTSELQFQFQGESSLPSFYSKNNDGMLPYALAHRTEIALLQNNNKELLQRYEALRTYPRYNEPLDCGFFAPIPSFSPLRNAQKIELLQLATLANQGELTGVLARLREDTEFWRFVSRNSSTLISKLIACACLGNDLKFAAELGASRPLNAREMQLVQEILRPFAVDEVSFASALHGEARYMLGGMELSYRLQFKSWNPNQLLYKSNATQNRMYADYRESINLAELPPQEFAQKVKEQKASKTAIHRIDLPFLYNPVGEFLAAIGSPAFQNYIERGHDLEGIRRLACLKVLSRKEKVPLERMQQFLATHVQDLGNPYTGEAMEWDEKSRAISFPRLSEEKPVNIYL